MGSGLVMGNEKGLSQHQVGQGTGLREFSAITKCCLEGEEERFPDRVCLAGEIASFSVPFADSPAIIFSLFPLFPSLSFLSSFLSNF